MSDPEEDNVKDNLKILSFKAHWVGRGRRRRKRV